MAEVIEKSVPVEAARGGMGVYGGAVARNGKVFPRYEAAGHGRQGGHLIEALLKVKWDILP